MRSLAPILYRWQRFAAFCLPMTSERMTHAACAVGRSRDGFLYLVFAYAQLNDPGILDRIEASHAAVLKRARAWRTAPVEEAAATVLDVGRWRRKEDRGERRRHLESDDPLLRAAAWDAEVLFDEEEALERLAPLRAAFVRAANEEGSKDRARESAEWMSRLRFVPDLAVLARGVLGGSGSAPPGGPTPPGK
jgi:hypothetical protein